jgi:Stress responsive A/B Barrel Domain
VEIRGIMITRAVMVEFHPHVTESDVTEFKGRLHDLAARASGLVRMACGAHAEAAGDGVLRKGAPSVVFGDFLSIWEFRDEAALDEFLIDPGHREMADKWRAVVKRRYVVNFR